MINRKGTQRFLFILKIKRIKDCLIEETNIDNFEQGG